MSAALIADPTKRTLIEMLEALPVAEDARLNVSINLEDISLVASIEASSHPDPQAREFLLNFNIG